MQHGVLVEPAGRAAEPRIQHVVVMGAGNELRQRRRAARQQHRRDLGRIRTHRRKGTRIRRRREELRYLLATSSGHGVQPSSIASISFGSDDRAVLRAAVRGPHAAGVPAVDETVSQPYHRVRCRSEANPRSPKALPAHSPSVEMRSISGHSAPKPLTGIREATPQNRRPVSRSKEDEHVHIEPRVPAPASPVGRHVARMRRCRIGLRRRGR